MLLSEPPETEYDLRLSAFGFPLRISWTFWLGAVVFGHNFAQLVDRQFAASSPGVLPLLVLWTICMLISIWIHELGHAVAFRFYGIQSTLVLYHFGGLAIPISSYNPGRSFARLRPGEDLLIALAGPVAQLLSAAAVIGVVKLAGYQVDAFNWMPAGLHRIPWVGEGEPIDSAGLYAIVFFYVFPSVLWALLNLVPVWPLDGGRIMRSIVLMAGGDLAQSLWISVITAGALAVYSFKSGNTMMAIFFAMFAFSSYQLTQQNNWR
ncbi:site-2 protease family protein [Stieleria varia]|uniref:Peptidase family M50 n=1 Tax=Stieleria varia TaxID=2528005 RepID=A0A5C6AME0_9BACT|nr:site-2 protease family protein [Stieleria varia]TWU01185.1 Peptidase family M50 [Stieleria varia]